MDFEGVWVLDGGRRFGSQLRVRTALISDKEWHGQALVWPFGLMVWRLSPWAAAGGRSTVGLENKPFVACRLPENTLFLQPNDGRISLMVYAWGKASHACTDLRYIRSTVMFCRAMDAI
jgi:hypothetical protein